MGLTILLDQEEIVAQMASCSDTFSDYNTPRYLVYGKMTS